MNTRSMVTIGMLAGLCVVCTFIKIPFGAGAMVHLGSAFIFTAAGVFGGVYVGMAAALGTALYDLLMGFSPYTLWSFVIKGIAGLIVGYMAIGWYPNRTNYSFVKHLVGVILATLWTLAGYVLAWWLVIGSWSVALANIPASLLTSLVGLLAAVFLTPILRKAMSGMITHKK